MTSKIMNVFVFIFIITLIFVGIYISHKKDYIQTHFGERETIDIEAKYKIINVSWQGSNLWVLLQDTATKEYKMINQRKYFKNIITFNNQ